MMSLVPTRLHYCHLKSITANSCGSIVITVMFHDVGNAVQTVKSVDSVKLITVRSTAFEAAAVGAGTAATESGCLLSPYL